MVTALSPAEFLAGCRSSGGAMPHARIGVNGDGVVQVGGESLFRGYWPNLGSAREWVTEDLGRIDERGQLHVLGRRDAVIIAGGVEVRPADVEAALRSSGEFDDVAVVGVPDAEWAKPSWLAFRRKRPTSFARWRRCRRTRSPSGLSKWRSGRATPRVRLTAWPCGPRPPPWNPGR
jgi:acyl-CoA synthetase (AMP-forming)/AMP-acid ligase II